MGTHIGMPRAVKTTIDIADDLIRRAKLVQSRDGVTLRALVEDGLRLVLDRDARKPKYRFEPVVVGTPYKPGKASVDVNALIAEINERDFVENDSARVAETVAAYKVGRKKPGARKKPGKRKT